MSFVILPSKYLNVGLLQVFRNTNWENMKSDALPTKTLQSSPLQFKGGYNLFTIETLFWLQYFIYTIVCINVCITMLVYMV